MSNRIVSAIVAAAVSVAIWCHVGHAQQPQPPQSLRLYVSTAASLRSNVATTALKVSEVADTRNGHACFLIAHPRGTLMWDTGEIRSARLRMASRPRS